MKALKILFRLCIVGIYLGTLFCAFVSSVVYDSRIEDLWVQDSQQRYTYWGTYNVSDTCQWSGCSHPAKFHLSRQVCYSWKSFSKIPISPSDANLTVETGSFTYKDTQKLTHTEKYLVLKQQANGDYRLDTEEESYDYTVEGDEVHTVYFTQLSGSYCQAHAEKADEIIVRDLDAGLKSHFVYKWGHAFPYNLIIITLLLAFFGALFSDAETIIPVVGTLIATIICCALTYGSTFIKSGTIRDVIVITMYLITTFFGTLFSFASGEAIRDFLRARRAKKAAHNNDT